MAHSTAVIGFWLAHTARRPGMLAEAVTDLFALILAGKLQPGDRRQLLAWTRSPTRTGRCWTAAAPASWSCCPTLTIAPAS